MEKNLDRLRNKVNNQLTVFIKDQSLLRSERSVLMDLQKHVQGTDSDSNISDIAHLQIFSAEAVGYKKVNKENIEEINSFLQRQRNWHNIIR